MEKCLRTMRKRERRIHTERKGECVREKLREKESNVERKTFIS